MSTESKPVEWIPWGLLLLALAVIGAWSADRYWQPLEDRILIGLALAAAAFVIGVAVGWYTHGRTGDREAPCPKANGVPKAETQSGGEDMGNARVAQLSELNGRSQKYAGQLWQVPFAYLGVGGLALGLLDNESIGDPAAAFLVYGIVGLGILAHMLGIREAIANAVDGIAEVECKLRLTRSVEHYEGRSLWPLLLVVGFSALVSLCGAFIVQR